MPDNRRIYPVKASVTPELLAVELADGRSVSVPTLWFPRLAEATEAERANVELTRDGLHWPDLDEDVSVAGLLTGRRSGESPASLDRWLKRRREADAV